MKTVSLMLVLAAGAFAQENHAAGRAEEKRSCTPCHGLQLVRSQRLSKATWEKELVKMEGWGAQIKDRQALLDYLVAEYGDDKPIPKPERTASGEKK